MANPHRRPDEHTISAEMHSTSACLIQLDRLLCYPALERGLRSPSAGIPAGVPCQAGRRGERGDRGEHERRGGTQPGDPRPKLRVGGEGAVGGAEMAEHAALARADPVADLPVQPRLVYLRKRPHSVETVDLAHVEFADRWQPHVVERDRGANLDRLEGG